MIVIVCVEVFGILKHSQAHVQYVIYSATISNTTYNLIYSTPVDLLMRYKNSKNIWIRREVCFKSTIPHFFIKNIQHLNFVYFSEPFFNFNLWNLEELNQISNNVDSKLTSRWIKIYFHIPSRILKSMGTLRMKMHLYGYVLCRVRDRQWEKIIASNPVNRRY